MASLIRNRRCAGRSLAGTPGFTLGALVALAPGIGANTAICSLVNAPMLRRCLSKARKNMAIGRWGVTLTGRVSAGFLNTPKTRPFPDHDFLPGKTPRGARPATIQSHSFRLAPFDGERDVIGTELVGRLSSLPLAPERRARATWSGGGRAAEMKRDLRLPDLDYAKRAVLSTPGSPESERARQMLAYSCRFVGVAKAVGQGHLLACP